jgi:hypothetical protein
MEAKVDTSRFRGAANSANRQLAAYDVQVQQAD